MAQETIVGGTPGRVAAGAGDLTDELVRQSIWTDEMLDAAGIPIRDAPLVTVGGGLGSLALIDYLRVAGLPADKIAVLTDIENPYDTYEYLTNNSQIPRHERLRSDSGSVIDSVWGFPSYAMREAWEDKSFSAAWHVLIEPVFRPYFTPRAGQVFRSLTRETKRIGWSQMRQLGYARMVRRRRNGGYFALLTPKPGTASSKRVAYRAQHVHLAVGYPGVKFLDDLQGYRDRYDDFTRVVNAYEPHPHVYEEALRRPTTVMVRGSGIVASRVLQRLLDDREHNGAQTRVIHLFRTYVDGPQTRDGHAAKRPGGDGFAYQGFNWPKATWGGQLLEKLASLEGEERARFLDSMGGTTTAPRRSWQQQIRRGKREGWYRAEIGEAEAVTPSEDGMSVVTTVRSKEGDRREIPSQFIVDATGLEASLTEHRLMADLLEHGGAGTNPKGRLDVERTFEVRGTRNGSGRMYASGSMTLGGYYAGVDSFLGLQYAALQIADDLARQGFCKKIGPLRSTAQWWRWMRNKPL